MKLRFIGDIHNQQGIYIDLIAEADYSIQLGDLGFDYNWLYDHEIDPTKHRFFGGNHDNYNTIEHSQHNLGDFGTVEMPGFNQTIFFVRGAWSIDAKASYRKEGINLWSDREELSMKDCYTVAEAYAKAKPDILLSHECKFSLLPSIIQDVGFALKFGYSTPYVKTRTNQMLDVMYETHKPKFHIFGHYHYDFDQVIDGTRMMCLTADGKHYPDLTQRFFDIDY